MEKQLMLSSGDYGLTSEPDFTSSSEERTREEEKIEEAAASLGAVQEKSAETKAEAAAQVTETAKQTRRTGARQRKRRYLDTLGRDVRAISKDVSNLRKCSDSSTYRLEKRLSLLHNEVISLKKQISKEGNLRETEQVAYLSKVLTRLTNKPIKQANSQR